MQNVRTAQRSQYLDSSKKDGAAQARNTLSAQRSFTSLYARGEQYDSSECVLLWAGMRCGTKCEQSCDGRSVADRALLRCKTVQPPCTVDGHMSERFGWLAPHVCTQV